MPKITKRLIDALPPGGERLILWDSELKGFGLVALPSGVRSFIVQYRNETGRKRRLTLGRFGVMTVDGARAAARETLAAVGKGSDPVDDRQSLRAAPSVSGALLDRYLAEHVDVHNAPKTAEGARLSIEKHIRPRLGGLRAAAVTRQDVLKLHRAMEETPRQANLTLRHPVEGLQPRRAMGYPAGGLEPLPQGAALSRIGARAVLFGRRAGAPRRRLARGGSAGPPLARARRREGEASRQGRKPRNADKPARAGCDSAAAVHGRAPVGDPRIAMGACRFRARPGRLADTKGRRAAPASGEHDGARGSRRSAARTGLAVGICRRRRTRPSGFRNRSSKTPGCASAIMPASPI